jgi:hypothetical protein
MFNEGFLYASLLWGTIGVGCLIYGKKQGGWTPAFTGVALIVISYVVQSPLIMSVAGIGLLVALRFLTRRGY